MKGFKFFSKVLALLGIVWLVVLFRSTGIDYQFIGVAVLTAAFLVV
ncbi:MAG: hypothetical protein KQI81_08890 [Deltaproteobacteria bacterium]|nr:hypothetical protein [Deltaproteobacteria bacterium]